MKAERGTTKYHIATRPNGGPVTRTYLRCNVGLARSATPQSLAEAAISLGGPKVKAAISRGKRVKTDWVERVSYIYHDGSDHHHAHVEILPWRISVTRERIGYAGRKEIGPVPAILRPSGEVVEVEGADYCAFNDVD